MDRQDFYDAFGALSAAVEQAREAAVAEADREAEKRWAFRIKELAEENFVYGLKPGAFVVPLDGDPRGVVVTVNVEHEARHMAESTAIDEPKVRAELEGWAEAFERAARLLRAALTPAKGG